MEYELGCKVLVGPSVNLTPSGTVALSGTVYDNPACSNVCVSIGYTGSVQMEVKAGATAQAWLKVFSDDSWLHIDGEFAAEIRGSCSDSFTASGSWNFAGCPTPPGPGWNGSLALGEADCTFTGKITYDGMGLFGTEKGCIVDGRCLQLKYNNYNLAVH